MGANGALVLQVEGCGGGMARWQSQRARVGRVGARIPPMAVTRPETDRAKTSRNLDSSDLSGDLSVIYLCRSVIFLCRSVIYLVIYLPFSDLQVIYFGRSVIYLCRSVIYLCHLVIYSL